MRNIQHFILYLFIFLTLFLLSFLSFKGVVLASLSYLVVVSIGGDI